MSLSSGFRASFTWFRSSSSCSSCGVMSLTSIMSGSYSSYRREKKNEW